MEDTVFTAKRIGQLAAGARTETALGDVLGNDLIYGKSALAHDAARHRDVIRQNANLT